MGFEDNSLTIASHCVMVVILFVLMVRSLATFYRGLAGFAVEYGLFASVAIFALGMIIERLYYIFARVLLPFGVNLWELHPVPEALSLVVGIGLYALMVPMVRASSQTRRAATRVICFEAAVLSSIWSAVVWVLY